MAQSNPHVYIVNQNIARPGKPVQDLDDLKRFTSAPYHFLTKGFVPFNKATELAMARELKTFRAEDYLVLNGSAALSALAMAIIKETNEIDQVKVLLYNAHRNTYGEDVIDGLVEI